MRPLLAEAEASQGEEAPQQVHYDAIRFKLGRFTVVLFFVVKRTVNTIH